MNHRIQITLMASALVFIATQAAAERPISLAGPWETGEYVLVNEDTAGYALTLRCGDQRWQAKVRTQETVRLGALARQPCSVEVDGGGGPLALSGNGGELVLEGGKLRERVRTLSWTPIREVYGQDGPWPDDVVSQWAVSARASSEYTAGAWSAMRATGAPDTPACGDAPTAWATLQARSPKPQWIELRFAERVRAVGARLYGTLAPGPVRQVQARTKAGWETVWKGTDPTASCPATLALRFIEEVDTDSIRIVLDLSQQDNWFELDAVELLGKPL